MDRCVRKAAQDTLMLDSREEAEEILFFDAREAAQETYELTLLKRKEPEHALERKEPEQTAEKKVREEPRAYFDLFRKLGLEIKDDVTSSATIENMVLSKYLSPVIDDICVQSSYGLLKKRLASEPIEKDHLEFSSFQHDSAHLYEQYCMRDDDGRVIEQAHPCSQGSYCVGVTGMLECQYTEENGDLFTGRIIQAYPLPGQKMSEARGKCLLCIRRSLTRLIATFDASQADVFDPRLVLQCFFNSNEMGEYQDHFLIFPGEDRYNGLVAPIAMYNQSKLCWMYDHSRELWYVDQSLYKKTSSVNVVSYVQKQAKK